MEKKMNDETLNKVFVRVHFLFLCVVTFYFAALFLTTIPLLILGYDSFFNFPKGLAIFGLIIVLWISVSFLMIDVFRLIDLASKTLNKRRQKNEK